MVRRTARRTAGHGVRLPAAAFAEMRDQLPQVADDVVTRGLELAQRVADLPRKAVLETKRRTLLERRHLWGFLL